MPYPVLNSFRKQDRCFRTVILLFRSQKLFLPDFIVRSAFPEGVESFPGSDFIAAFPADHEKER
jgi:hypothetical protein